MANSLHRYDSYWSSFNSDTLRKISPLWGAPSKMAKEDRIAYLVSALRDPQQIDAALQRMQPFERAALGIVQWMGGTADLDPLGIAVRATGTAPTTDRYAQGYNMDAVAEALVEHGIVMQEGGYRFIGSGYYSDAKRVFTDDRILTRISSPEHRPLAVQAMDPPTTSTVRRVPSVVLEILSVLRTIDAFGGIGLTKSGLLRVNDMRKVARALGWGDSIKINGLTFPQPLNAYIIALKGNGLLVQKSESLVIAGSLEQAMRSPAAEMLGSLVRALIPTEDWLEIEQNYEYNRYKDHISASRLGVLSVLRCLPERTVWVRFSDFERALFERIGEFHSVTGRNRQPHFFRQTPEEKRAEMAKWQQSIQANWIKEDVSWIQAMFQTWMYAFGLVELHLMGNQVERFRLTDLGRAFLWDEPLPEQTQHAEAREAAWIVQPNFDVVAYLENASTEQMVFLEQYAERIQLAQHTAQYRLTRDSVYEGLQHGGGADSLLEGLAAGSRVPLPSNVQAEIRNWAILRERIQVRKHADLIEFANASERQDAIAQGLQGLPVGDRFLLRPENSTLPGLFPKVIDYSQKPDNQTLFLNEEGVITLVPPHTDLLTLGLLNLWAEPESSIAWRLTRKSIEQATQRGRKLSELKTFLQDRLVLPIPGLLQVALQTWAGAPVEMSLALAVILQCAHPDTLDALLKSHTLKPHLLGQIGPTALLVKSTSVDAVQAVLDWAGIRGSARLLV